MKLLAFLLAFLPFIAEARVGETEEQLWKRFGERQFPWESSGNKLIHTYKFRFNRVDMIVVTVKGVCVRETYDSSFDKPEEILEAVSDGKPWQRTSVLGQPLKWKLGQLRAAMVGNLLVIEHEMTESTLADARKIPAEKKPSGF